MADAAPLNYSILIPSPEFHVDLAPLDALHPVHYACRLLFFRCASAEQRAAQLEALTAGLRGLVRRCPVLGGQVTRPPTAGDGSASEAVGPARMESLPAWRTIVPGDGVELIVRDRSAELPSFAELDREGFPSARLPYALLAPFPPEMGAEGPACKVQYSYIKGGCVVAFSMSHSVADGAANNEMMRIWSEETRQAQDGSITDDMAAGDNDKQRDLPPIGLDRTLLRDITSPIPFNIADHPAFFECFPPTNPDDQVDPPHPFRATGPEIPLVLRVSATKLAQLKVDATSPDGGPAISTHDAICALIWRTVLLVRSRRGGHLPARGDSSGNPPPEIHFFMPSDARRHLNLRPSYIGNAVYQLRASLSLPTLLHPSSGLQAGALAIRHAILAPTAPLLASYMAELRDRWLPWGFLIGTNTLAVAAGTDWTSGAGIYETDDWGPAFGHRLVRFRYPTAGGAGNVVFPKLPDGTAEICLGVMPEEVAFVKGVEGFGRYL